MSDEKTVTEIFASLKAADAELDRKMTDPTNFHMERIEKLLRELRYEIERGMINHDIEEEIGYRFYVPISSKIPNGVVLCEFRTRPVPRHEMDVFEPHLKLVKK